MESVKIRKARDTEGFKGEKAGKDEIITE